MYSMYARMVSTFSMLCVVCICIVDARSVGEKMCLYSYTHIVVGSRAVTIDCCLFVFSTDIYFFPLLTYNTDVFGGAYFSFLVSV